MIDEYHALASPSAAHRWLHCANSLAMEIGQPEGDTKAADLGTDKHELLGMCLQFGKDAMDYEGQILKKGHTVNKELASDVQTVIDNVRERQRGYLLRGCSVDMEIEQDVPIGHITGENKATGRVDVSLIVIWPDGRSSLDIIDAKFGYQEVEVKENEQLMMYAEGTVEKHSLTECFDHVNLVIEQPLRSSASQEWTIDSDELSKWRREIVRPAAERAIMIHKMVGQRALKEEDFAPSESTCKWCKAKAICPALKAKIELLIEASFDEKPFSPIDTGKLSVEQLSTIFPHLKLVEDWIKAVRARIEHEVFAGNTVPGVKVVQGKRGNRAWSSDDEAEAMMKKFKMKQEQMYSLKLLGPKPILEALKDQPRRLKQIEQLIVQPEGKPYVVHESDPRPAIEIKPIEDGFETKKDELC